MLSNLTAPTGDQLASALHVLGVNFVIGGKSAEESFHQKPALLIAALAESREARLRLSLIPLFLEHPEFAEHARKAAQSLNASARLTLQCYYSAAVCMQQIHRTRWEHIIGKKPALPDLFAQELGLEDFSDPQTGLHQLAKRHQTLSGSQVNWLGTYQHAWQVWLKGLEARTP